MWHNAIVYSLTVSEGAIVAHPDSRGHVNKCHFGGLGDLDVPSHRLF